MRRGRPVAHDRGIGHAAMNGAPVRKLQWPQNQPAGIDDGQIQMKPPLRTGGLSSTQVPITSILARRHT
jgi:hypothetical protein